MCNTPCYSFFYATGVHGGVPAWLADLGSRVEAALNVPSGYFNAFICRLYKDGTDKIDWHTDLRRNLDDADMVIGSVSLGPAARVFSMRPVTNVWSLEPAGHPGAKKVGAPETYTHYTLARGDLFGMMGRECQSKFEHAVLPDKRCNSWRININFRHIMPEWREEGLYRFYRYCVYGDAHPLTDRHLSSVYAQHSIQTHPDTFPQGSTLARDVVRAVSSQRSKTRTLTSYGFASSVNPSPTDVCSTHVADDLADPGPAATAASN